MSGAGILALANDGNDPFSAYVALLLHGDGANGSTSIMDSGPHELTPTVSGSVALSTAQKKWGTASILGNGGNLVFNDSNLIIGTQNYSLEFWIYFNSVAAGQGIAETDTGVSRFWIDMSSIGNMEFYHGASTSFNTEFSTGQWYFVQANRVNNGTTETITLGVNGLQVNSQTTSPSQNLTSAKLHFLRGTAGFGPANAYLDDVRVTIGAARAIAMPTEAFPNP